MLDMQMPGMNGIETLEKIRSLDSRVAAIMMVSTSRLRTPNWSSTTRILPTTTSPSPTHIVNLYISNKYSKKSVDAHLLNINGL